MCVYIYTYLHIYIYIYVLYMCVYYIHIYMHPIYGMVNFWLNTKITLETVDKVAVGERLLYHEPELS